VQNLKQDTLELFNDSTKKLNKTTNKKKLKASKIPKPSEDAVNIWNSCLDIIRDNLSNANVYKTWFEPINVLKVENNTITILVPSQFFYEWIEDNYYDLLDKTLKQVIGPDARLHYEIVVDDSDDTLEKRTIKFPGLKFPPSGNQNKIPFSDKNPVINNVQSNLNPRYVFDNFITGESNQLAYSASISICKNPGKTRFNPLVIYGDSGLGKTHLVEAIGNTVASENPNARILYTDGNKFFLDFVKAIQEGKQNEFVNFYRTIDVLIVDDIQFFEGKDKSQDNFYHIFNALHQSGKQIILSSDRPPKELKGVSDRLISRFQWGLTVDIQPPDFEMRVAILQQKSQDEGLELPFEIIEYMAQNIKKSVRELEGALINILAKTTFDNKPMNLDTVKEVLHGFVKVKKEDKSLTIEDIKEKVATYYKLSIEMLESKSRKHEIVLARQMAMYFAKQLTTNSLKNIGSYFGGRDHTTVLHSFQTIENYLVTDKAVKNAYETLYKIIKEDDE
jgi:chromosomal replication initiator protein